MVLPMVVLRVRTMRAITPPMHVKDSDEAEQAGRREGRVQKSADDGPHKLGEVLPHSANMATALDEPLPGHGINQQRVGDRQLDGADFTLPAPSRR